MYLYGAPSEDEWVDVDEDLAATKGFALVFDNVNQKTEARYVLLSV